MFNEAYEANFVEISRQVLRQNAKAVTDYVKVPVIGVVKFDGYGMGIAEAARAWQSAGVTMFAVSESWEALALRREGFTEDILLMAPVADREVLTQLLEKDIILTVSNLDNAWFYRQGCGEYTPRVHVKVDTGMGRFGVRWTDTQQLKDIYDMKELRFEGIFSHFGKSFEKNYKLTAQQLERFRTAVKALTDSGIDVGMRHIANSCAALRFPETWLDAVRAGIILYGMSPDGRPWSGDSAGFRPVMQLETTVAHIQTLLPGEHVSYGATYTAAAPRTTVTLPIGYADGWIRAYTGSTVRIGSREFPIIGRICMDQCMADITGAEESVHVGDRVILFGADHGESVSALAAHAGTIVYECTCQVSARVPRVPVSGTNF